MNTMKRKGFTLVELLVVIAILAILATVSVVGYTSFIERASVSNDQNLAAQINSFVTYAKADSNGKYYNVEITPDNAREIINHALVEGGLEGKLEPQSAEHGYHYYYDLKEEKIVVLNDAIDETALSMHILRGLGVVAYDYSVSDNPATCFTKKDPSFTKYGDVRYVFLDTAGSELAELVNLFYNINSAEDFARLNELAGMELLDGKKITAFTPLINKSIFVGSSGSFMTATGDKTLFFGTTMSSDKYLGGSKVDAFTVPSTLPMYVPSTIKFFTTNSLNFDSTTYDSSAATHTTVLHLNLTLDELAKKVDPSFTNVVFTLADGKQYACVDSQIVCLEEGGATVTITPKNPISNFDFEILDNGSEYIYNNVVTDGNNVAYISWDSFATGTTFKLNATKLVGAHDDLYDAVSSGKFVWSVHDDSASYLALVNANGEFKFTGTIPAITDGTCVVKVTAKDEIGGVEKTFEIRIVRVKEEQTITLDGKTVNANSANTLVFNNGAANEFVVTATANFTYNSVIADGNIKGGATFNVVSASGNLIYANDKLTVKSGLTGTSNETLTFTYGNYTFTTKSLALFDASELPYGNVSNYTEFKVGNGNKLKASDFFVLKHTNWAPLGKVKLYVSTPASNTDITTEIDLETLLSTDYVDANIVEGVETEFQFKGTYTSGVSLYLVHEYNGETTRISGYFPINLVVNGNNARTWDDIKSGVKDTNVVLLKNIAFDTNGQITIDKGTLYGNNFVLDVRNGINKAEYIIKLQNTAKLDTVKVVGSVYTSFTYDNHTENADASAAVLATDGTEIINSYIANTRAPLRTSGNVTVSNSTFFGGKYANIDVTNGVLALVGNVTTINQPYNGNAGLGIVVDLWANADTKVVANSCNLKQYNFLPNTLANDGRLPTVTLTITVPVINKSMSGSVNLNTTFKNVFKKAETETDYEALRYSDGTTYYCNAGIVYANTYKLYSDSTTYLNVDNGGSLTNAPDGYSTVQYTETKGPKQINMILTKINVYADATIDIYSPARTKDGAEVADNITLFNNRNTVMNQYTPENYCAEIYN